MCFEHPTILASQYDIAVFITLRGRGGNKSVQRLWMLFFVHLILNASVMFLYINIKLEKDYFSYSSDSLS